MNKAVIFRLILGMMLVAEGMELGKTLYIRKMCYAVEQYGRGIVTYTDIHGKDHHAIIEADK